VVPVSAARGTGIDTLASVLEGVLDGVPPARDVARPRLSVDRAFTLAGFGTVVTGTLRDGRLHDGDGIEILPAGTRARVRGLQSHGRPEAAAPPGTRTAVNLAAVGTDAVARGDVVALPGTYPVTQLADVTITLLPDAQRPLAHDAMVHLFHGAAEIPARVRIIGARRIEPGGRGPAQLRLSHATVLAAGDRFVLRLPSPPATIGGGTVLDPCPPGRRRRLRPEVLERFAALEGGAAEDVVWHMLAEREPCAASALAPSATGVEPADRDAALAALATAGRVLKLGDAWITDRGWATIRQRTDALVGAYHGRHPLREGVPTEEIRARLGLPASTFPAVVDRAAGEGWLVRDGTTLRHPSHRVALSAEARARTDALLARYRAAPYTPPTAREAEEAVGPAVLAALLARGDLVATGSDVLFDRAGYDALCAGVLAHIDAHRQVTVADVRDRFATSRKFALALLEHLDHVRVTRRVGDARVRGPAAPPAPAPHP
jgi:selenocysteine-specific elongation factor